MIGRAAALTNLGDKDRAFRAKKQAFGSFFRFSPCRCALMRRKLRQRQIPSFGRRMVRVCRETDFSGCCFARKYDGMRMPGKASLCHPCRQPSAPACGVPRRRNGSRAQRRQRQVRRECRNEDFSGCYFARKYNCMGTPKKKPPFVTRVASRAHPLAGCRGAAAETERSEGRGQRGGNVDIREAATPRPSPATTETSTTISNTTDNVF